VPQAPRFDHATDTAEPLALAASQEETVCVAEAAWQSTGSGAPTTAHGQHLPLVDLRLAAVDLPH
jgi:hypothetical protein